MACPQLQDDHFQKVDSEPAGGSGAQGGSVGHTSGSTIPATIGGPASIGTSSAGGAAGLTTSESSAGGVGGVGGVDDVGGVEGVGAVGGVGGMGGVGGSDGAVTESAGGVGGSLAGAGGASSTNGGSAGTATTSACNNGVAEADEECDGADLRGASCASEELGLGELGCTEACVFDTSECEPAIEGDCDSTAGSTGEVLSADTSEYESRVLEHGCTEGGKGPDVSFAWIAPATGCFLITVSSTRDLDTILGVYDDCTLALELACDDNGGYDQLSELYFEATENTSYAVVVDSYFNSDTGPITVTIVPCE